MKIRLVSLILLACGGLLSASAAEKIVAGPKGGRLLNVASHHAEFLVTPERKVEITFYDEDLKPVVHGAHKATVIAEAPGGRQTLNLTETPHGFASVDPLPAGEPYRVVVQFRTGPQQRAQNHRIDLSLETCGECQHAEYACICAH